MTTIASPLESVGCVAATTSPSTPSKSAWRIHVNMQANVHLPGNPKMVTFTWEGYHMQATVWPEGPRPTRQRQWYFSVGLIQHPIHFRSHELPIFSAFLLECHSRLSASIRDNKFNPNALEINT